MAVSDKPIRLSKAAREFNVGISTIVEFLAKKGMEISSNPNTKLMPDVYELLEGEFESQKSVKQEASKIGLDYTDHRTISIEDQIAKQREVDEDDDFDDDGLDDVDLIQQVRHAGRHFRRRRFAIAGTLPGRVWSAL